MASEPIVIERTVALKKQVGLITGVALIAGTMIGKFKTSDGLIKRR